MDEQRAARLGEITTEAGIERASFLTAATAQFVKFLEDNAERVEDLGGLVLIDDGPEYLEITADGTFKSRTRVQDESGDWVTEDEVIASGAEIIEDYHPADLYAAFADSARQEADLPEQPAASDDLPDSAGDASEVGADQDEEQDDDSADDVGTPEDKDDAARMLYDLALTYQERSQNSQAQLLDRFEDASEGLASMVGGTMIVDDEGERIWYRANGIFEAEVLPAPDDDDEGEDPTDTDESEPEWQALATPQEMVQFYDPTDLFGDLAETIAEDHPSVAPEEDDDSVSS